MLDPKLIVRSFASTLTACCFVACSASSVPIGGDGDAGDDAISVGDVGAIDAGGDIGQEDAIPVIDTGSDVGADTVAPPDASEEDSGPLPAVCGNGRVDPGEACDDGNNFPGDGCSPDCSSNEQCGNAIVDLGEGCDDGNLRRGDGCDHRCQPEEGCGNGVVDVGEQCDDGNVTPGDGCNEECQREISLVLDSDNDGISDFDEGSGFVDTDGDTITDELDTDSDNDGVPDSVEAGDDDLATEPVDTDRDGRPDFRDTDADDDGILDSVEGYDDPDGDGIGNYADFDSDGDYVPDSLEGLADTDSDGTPDYLDRDSDGDTVLDSDELFADSDGDLTPNRLDLDSDNDGIPDSVEAGDSDPTTYPVDTDADGQPDMIDIDSDDDGLPDFDELGCPGSSEPLDWDSDDDGYSDLGEVLVGSDACTPTSAEAFKEYTDFFFVLPYEEEETAALEFSSDIARADVHINIDSSGSMDGEIDNLSNGMSSFIVPRIAAEIDDVGFGFSDYRDCDGYAFRLRQRITTSVPSVQSAINGLTNTSGGLEPGYSALWHIGTGGTRGSCLDLPSFGGGGGEGSIGGVGFRDDAFPVVIHVTDESAEDGDCGGCAASKNDAVNALRGIDARMIGIVSSSSPRSELRDIASRTSATVPVCAWDGARPSGCGASQCCTGNGGAGESAVSGQCPLVFGINSNGTGLRESIVTGIVALVNTTSFDVTTRLRRDEDEYRASGLDTRCFIDSIIPNRSEGAGTCSTDAIPADIAPADGVLDSFQNVTPGTQLFFDVTAENNCVPQLESPQSFFAYIDVIGDGVTVLDTQSVTIIVPASTTNPSTVP